jgi:hypothetical protein
MARMNEKPKRLNRAVAVILAMMVAAIAVASIYFVVTTKRRINALQAAIANGAIVTTSNDVSLFRRWLGDTDVPSIRLSGNVTYEQLELIEQLFPESDIRVRR